jgi:transcriptional regulator with PAS, ATPase and Fis domain
MLSKVPTFEFEAVFDALDVGIVVLDSHGSIIVWNDWLAGVSRISKESALGKNLCDLFPSLRDTRRRWAAPIAQYRGAATRDQRRALLLVTN